MTPRRYLAALVTCCAAGINIVATAIIVIGVVVIFSNRPGAHPWIG